MFSSFGAETKEGPSNKVHLLKSSHAYVEQNKQRKTTCSYTGTQHATYYYTAHDEMIHNTVSVRNCCVNHGCCLHELITQTLLCGPLVDITEFELIIIVKVYEPHLRLGDVNNLVAQLKEDRVLW